MRCRTQPGKMRNACAAFSEKPEGILLKRILKREDVRVWTAFI